MATYESKGIIFRNIKYGESSIICDIYTEDKGLRSFIVSGVRNAKSKTAAGIYRPLHIVQLTAYDAGSGKLARIKEIHFDYVFQYINIHVVRSGMALFMLEIARNALRNDEADPDLFRFIRDSLIKLDASEQISPLFHIKFMIELSHILGFGALPNRNENTVIFDLLNGQFDIEGEVIQYRMDKEVSHHFFTLLECETEKIGELQIPKNIRMQMLDDLITYFRLHVPGFKEIMSKDVLMKIL